VAIKLVAIDLDDTLLRDDLTISPRVRAAIREAQRRGVRITLATGRMPISARPYAEQLGLDLPAITYHGALIQQVLSEEVLFRRVVPKDLAARMVADFLTLGVHTQIYIKNRVFAQRRNPWSREYSRLAAVAVEERDLREVLRSEPEGVDKILLMGEERDLDAMAPQLRAKYGGQVHITKSKPMFLEVTDLAVNKGVALAALADRFGIAQAETMAIGDSFNDLEMIEYAGLGVAMGNARPEVKAKADLVTGTNQEDGVAQALERCVLTCD